MPVAALALLTQWSNCLIKRQLLVVYRLEPKKLNDAFRDWFSRALVFSQYMQYTITNQHCNQYAQQQASQDITPVVLIVTDSRQCTQETQLCYQKLKKELEKPAVRKIDLGFHVEDYEGHSICCNKTKRVSDHYNIR